MPIWDIRFHLPILSMFWKRPSRLVWAANATSRWLIQIGKSLPHVEAGPFRFPKVNDRTCRNPRFLGKYFCASPGVPCSDGQGRSVIKQDHGAVVRSKESPGLSTCSSLGPQDRARTPHGKGAPTSSDSSGCYFVTNAAWLQLGSLRASYWPICPHHEPRYSARRLQA